MTDTTTEQIDQDAQDAVAEALQRTSGDASGDQGETGTDTHEQPDVAVSEPDSANQEAARYRRRLRDTEQQRDDLQQRLQAMQRAEVERVAGEFLQAPNALWASDIDLEDLLTADGIVDEHKVHQAAQQARVDLGLAAPLPDNYVPHAGLEPQMPTGAGSPAARAAAVIRGPRS